MPPDVGVQAGESMVPLPRPLATANKFNSVPGSGPSAGKRPNKVVLEEVEDEGEIERPMRVVTAIVPPKPQSGEAPEISMPPRKRADSTSSMRSRSSASNSTPVPARATPSPSFNARGKQPSPSPNLRGGKQSPVPSNPRKPPTPAPVSRSQTEPKLPSIAEKPLPSTSATRGVTGDDAEFADPAVAAMLAKFAESQAKAAQEIRAKSPEAVRAKSPTTSRAMSPETVRAESPETARAQSPTARGNDLRFRSFSEAQTASTPSPAPAAARRMRSPVPPSTSPAPSGWRRAGTPAATRPAASRTVSSNPAFPASKPSANAKGAVPTPNSQQAGLAQKAEQLKIEAEQKAAEKRRIEEEKEREFEARAAAVRAEQEKREQEAAAAGLRAEEEEKQRVAAEEEKKIQEAEARAEEEKKMQQMWASRTKGKQPQAPTRPDPKGKGKQRAVEVDDVEMSPPARGRVKVDHEFALRLQAEELARAQAAASKQNLNVSGNTIHAPTAISPSPSWSMPAPRGPTTAATSTPAPAWTTWGKGPVHPGLTSPPSQTTRLSPPGPTTSGWSTTAQTTAASPSSRSAHLSPPQTMPGSWSTTGMTSPPSQTARLSPLDAKDEDEWQRRLDERARAQAEAFQREQERVAQSQANKTTDSTQVLRDATAEEKLWVQEIEAARVRVEEDRRLAQELQSEEWHQAAMRRQAAQQTAPVAEVSQRPSDAAAQRVQNEIARLKAEIEERKRVAEQKAQAAASLRGQAEARRRDAETLMRIWEGRSLAGNAIAA